MANPFFDTTAVRASGPGQFTGAIHGAWNLSPLPQGGVATALALRAMAQELQDPAQTLRTLHTTFVAQVADGPVAIEVELLRRGRSMSHLRAEVANTGSARGHLTTGIFGSPRPGFTFTDLEPPEGVPPPLACPSFRDPPPPGVEAFPPMPFWDRLVEGGRPEAIRRGRTTSPTAPSGRCGTGSTGPRYWTTAPSTPGPGGPGRHHARSRGREGRISDRGGSPRAWI